MLEILMSDLVIRLSESGDILQMLIPKENGKAGELHVFHEISANEIAGGEAPEDVIGKAVLSFLSATCSLESFGLGAYRKAGQEFAQTLENESISLLESGDSDSEFEGVMLLLHRFDPKWTLADVERINALIEKASRSGSIKATEFLVTDWPARSEALKRRIARSQRES